MKENFSRYKKYFYSGFLVLAGYLLSPLSWWNDLILNIPIALLLAYLVSFFNKGLFLPLAVLFYWLTNIAGLVMMHRGLIKVSSTQKENFKSALIKDLIISVLYTILIIVLIKLQILKFLPDYLNKLIK